MFLLIIGLGVSYRMSKKIWHLVPLIVVLKVRETVPSQTSDMGKKTVSVLAHSFLLPSRANLVYILSITPLKHSRS